METSDHSGMGGNGEGRVVALTGAVGVLGVGLIRALEADPRCRKILAFDLQRPSFEVRKTHYFHTDLTVPGTDERLAEILTREGADAFVHLAFLHHHAHSPDWAHELESIGTMRVLDACAAARISKFVLWSHSVCYGASPNHPALLEETHPLAQYNSATDGFVGNKIDAERQVRTFASQQATVEVVVLRMAPLIGPECPNFTSRLLRQRFIPVLMGYDPLIQFLHPDDGALALTLALEPGRAGVFNIASDGAVPLRTAIALLGRVPVPVPWTLARQLAGALWMGQVIDVPPSFLSFLRFSAIMDTGKAKRELGYRPRYSVQDLLHNLVSRPPGPATVPITLSPSGEEERSGRPR